MICLNLSLCIVAAFLVLTLIVGIYFSRKKTTFREYAVGNKDFGTATLVATVLATSFGAGGLVRNVECVHRLGLFWIMLGFLNCFGSWVISRLALRMGPFMKHLSMAETIGSVYGSYPRIFTALVSICTSIVIISGQIIVMSTAISISLGSVDHYLITLLSTLLLIFYSIFGGVRAVTYTDVLQFITFSIIIPLLSWFMFIKIGKPVTAIISTLQAQPKFQFSNLFHFNKELAKMVLLFLSFIVPYMGPGLMQRIYMSSDPIQAQKVFAYTTFFKFIITLFIVLVGLFVFVGAPDLTREGVWDYIMNHIPPSFKGFLSISLLAMAMSTADSSLNACSVIVTHDILKTIQNKSKVSDASQLKIARCSTLLLGLLAMVLAFKCPDLLKLFYWSLDCDGPIVAMPFILAVFGFRGTTRTALIGMFTGVLTILAWNRWVQPSTGLNGSFIAMLANGLAMIAAHYWLKQPEGAGWVGPDYHFQQMQQERARKQAERKEMIQNSWLNRKITLSKLMPNHAKMVYVGLYLVATSFLTYFTVQLKDDVAWLILKLFLAACCIGYPFIYDISKKIRAIPRWFIGLCWLVGLAIYFPLNLLGHWWHLVDPIFSASLSLAHFALILWVLPLYIGIGVVATTLLVSIYPIAIGLSFADLSLLAPLFIAGLLIFSAIISLKVKLVCCINKILYLEGQQDIRASQQLKASLYDAAIVPSSALGKPNRYGSILTQVVRKIEESISFLDDKVPLYKEDFQSIINKFYDWVAYFNRREKTKEHALLQPTQISLNKLIRKVEFALAQEVADPPRLLVEYTKTPNKESSPNIVCDINQIVYLLVKAVLQIGNIKGLNPPVVRIQFQQTSLQFTKADAIEEHDSAFMAFQATALVISQAITPAGALPKVKQCYDDRTDAVGPKADQATSRSIDLQHETISTIVSAHYGYLEAALGKQQPTMLLVLPTDVSQILTKMTAKLPIDCLTSQASVSPKEQADSMMALMKFHDYVAKSIHPADPIDIRTVSNLLVLLRQRFGFKRHASGQLFYVRAIGISQLLLEWVFHSPKVIYASLLYELVRHTCLPLSYIKQHYNLGVYAFVLNVIGIDKRQALDHPSLLYVQNRLKEALKEDHVQLSVLFIKLAERLYDLRHAADYTYLTEVVHMAQETLAIDVKIAGTYLDPEIASALEKAANEALAMQNDASEKGRFNA